MMEGNLEKQDGQVTTIEAGYKRKITESTQWVENYVQFTLDNVSIIMQK